MKGLLISSGKDKQGNKEKFDFIKMYLGEMISIVGNTGSGKSRLIRDIEQLVQGDSITGRYVSFLEENIDFDIREKLCGERIAHLGQNMKFVSDTTVEEFLQIHISCRNNRTSSIMEIICLANSITPEPIIIEQNLTTLSGGQSRALMIADIALVCQSPIVLIDEIENAGIDKKMALKALTGANKLVLTVSHDPHTVLLCPKRIIMQNGAVISILNRSTKEESLMISLEKQYEENFAIQKKLRGGKFL